MRKDYTNFCNGCKHRLVFPIYMGDVVVGETEGCAASKRPQICHEYERVDGIW